jgi:prolyl oligopeptidase
VPLPFDGSIDFLVTTARRTGALVRLQSWTRPPVWFEYAPNRKRLVDAGLVPRPLANLPGAESVETEAPGADGVMIPLSIVSPRGIARDGSHPTLLLGYGAYGISIDPFFDPGLAAWIGQGGVFAVAHVRGGGEYGEEWHQAGRLATKPNTWRDFIACAEYLIAQGYTAPGRLAGTGTSAGGILIGRAITERPNLFRAAVPRVGVMNALRTEHEPGGPANIPEFGTTADSGQFRALMEMDAVRHVKPGVKYPAVLLTAGINDSRVEAWQPAKMTAALQEASASGYPVLLRVGFDAGHGMGLTKTQRSEETADIDAFLLWQLGAPAFQLRP